MSPRLARLPLLRAPGLPQRVMAASLVPDRNPTENTRTGLRHALAGVLDGIEAGRFRYPQLRASPPHRRNAPVRPEGRTETHQAGYQGRFRLQGAHDRA